MLRGWCERAGCVRIGFGEAAGTVLPALMRSAPLRNYRYYDLILGAYVCVLLCANLIGPAKVSTVQVPGMRRGHLHGRRAVLPDLLRLR